MKIYKVFNQEQWHVSKAKHLIWDNLIMDAKIARDRMVKFVKISAYLAEALLKGLTKLGGGARKVLCRWDRMTITWDWNCHLCSLFWHFGMFLGGLGLSKLSLVGSLLLSLLFLYT